MRAVRDRDTKSEFLVRKLLYADGFRFRLQARELPGRPDIVFRQRKRAIFVHGCFWHRHQGCHRTTTPKTRRDYWLSKFDDNVARDGKAITQLGEMNWRVLFIWECETKDLEAIRAQLL